MSLLITNCTVVTVDPAHCVIENGAVYIEEDRIVAVGDTGALREQYPTADTVVDGKGKVVLPGFVSAHNHVGYAVFRGRAEDIGHAPVSYTHLTLPTICSV